MANKNFWTQRTPQVLAALSASVGGFAFGSTLGWASPSLPSLEALRPFDINDSIKAWITSITVLGAAFSCPIAGLLAEKLGRKRTIVLMTFPYIIGWLLIILANSPYMFNVGRFVTGFAGGTYTVTVPMYISEIADSQIRGRLVGCFQLMMVFGILFAYIIGSLSNWYYLSIICCVIPFMVAIFMVFMPESPHFLIARGRISEASRRLTWLRSAGVSINVDLELREIQKGIQDAQSSRPLCREFFTPHILKPTGICFALVFFQQFSGINAVILYAHSIFADAGSEINDNAEAIILATAMVVANGVSTGLVDKSGRRVLLLVSQIIVTISLIIIGMYFYLKDIGNENTVNIAWVPLISLIVFVAAFSLGLGPIPWIYMSEVLPQHVKGLTTAMTMFLSWSLAFFVAQFFEQYQNRVGDEWCWWTFAICSGTGIIFTYALVPETRGRTLEEIQQGFHRNTV